MLNKHPVLPLPESNKSRFFYGYVIVIVGFFAMALMWGTTLSFGVFLKPMSAEFGWTRAATSGAYSMSMFLLGLLGMVTGRLNDKFGPRIVMTICSFALGLGFLLMAQISALWQLYLLYGVMVAIGTSGGYVPLTSTVARWFVKKRGLMTGIVLSGYGAGAMIGPPVANWLISDYGWRTSYFIMGIATLVSLVLVSQFLRRDPGETGQLAYGEGQINSEELVIETREFSPREATRTRQFWLLCLVFACVGISQIGIMVHIVPHATDLGISTFVAANILAVIGGLNMAGRIGLGSVADRIGNKSALTISLIVLSVSLFWLLFAKELWMFYLFAVIFGFGFGGISALMSPIVAELFGMRAHGAIVGMVTFAWGISAAVGPALAGHIFDIASSYYLGFIVFAVLSVIGLVLVLFLRYTSRKDLR